MARTNTRLLLVAGILLATLSSVTPAGAATSYQRCESRISRDGFYRLLRVDNIRCVVGARIARAWVSQYGYKPSPRDTLVRGFQCRQVFLQGDDNPYGRITCRNEFQRVRFYGVS